MNVTLHTDGQSTEVDVPPDIIIDVVDADDDITDDEDSLRHDLAESDNEDLINVDDDGVDKMSADVARFHDSDGGGEDRPPPHHVPSGYIGCFTNRAESTSGRAESAAESTAESTADRRIQAPTVIYALKKTFKTIGLGYESIHACEHDCCLFRGDDNKDLDFCPVCNMSRWKDSNTPRKKVPKKVLHYFPIIPRLQRLYKSSHTAKEMIWHATGKCTKPGKMQHPVDGRAWKKFDTKYPGFAKEPRNVRLGLAADGFNLFGNLSQAYNMWPVKLTTYNLPSWLCMKESSFMLTLLIPGPKSP
nr:hypothetical protein [Tanacetum cinerariifolium]